MKILNGENEADSGQVVVRKGLNMAFLSQTNNLQEELTIEESIFASDHEILKVIGRNEKALENLEDEDKYQAAFDEMDSYNAWDFETQFKQQFKSLSNSYYIWIFKNLTYATAFQHQIFIKNSNSLSILAAIFAARH
jgi:ATP-binding cassette subfamily F protein uup